MIQESEMRRPIFTLHIPSRFFLGVYPDPFPSIFPPHFSIVASFRVVRFCARYHSALLFAGGHHLNRKSPVMSAACSFQLIHPAQTTIRHRVQLSGYALTRSRNFQEEWDLERPANKGKFLYGSVCAFEDGVSGFHQVF